MPAITVSSYTIALFKPTSLVFVAYSVSQESDPDDTPIELFPALLAPGRGGGVECSQT
jgi:hypothetical protein